MSTLLSNFSSRRDFVNIVGRSISLSMLLTLPGAGFARGVAASQKNVTVGDVMDLFIREIPGAPLSKTVDTLKSGNREIVVTGVVTTIFATVEVIRKAIALNANFIIAHEPTFYNHQDETKWLENDEVYRYKAELLAKNKIAVWRCHDYLHAHNPDGVRMGLLKDLGWQQYAAPDNPRIVTLPGMPLKELITHAKQKLGIAMVRYEGDLAQNCKRILLLPGAAGGTEQIKAIGSVKPDVIMVGELSEWETAEYIRDARLKGDKISIVILGHALSEEAGLAWMLEWLQPKVPGIKVTHIPSNNPLSFL